MPITLDLIQRTRIGLIVNTLRKTIKDDDIGVLSKTLIKNWKKLLEQKDAAAAAAATTKTDSGSNGSGGKIPPPNGMGTKMIVDGGPSSNESSQGAVVCSRF